MPSLYVLSLQETVLWCLLICASVTDIWKGLIYNWLTLPAMAFGLLMATMAGGWLGFGFSFAGIAIGIAVFLPGYCKGHMGGGDVKLIAAVGAIAGPQFVIGTFLSSIVIGGIIAAGLLMYRTGILKTLKWYFLTMKIFFMRRLYKGSDFAYPLSIQGGTFPFAISIFLGALLIYNIDFVILCLR